jgi:hypothetical protein
VKVHGGKTGRDRPNQVRTDGTTVIEDDLSRHAIGPEFAFCETQCTQTERVRSRTGMDSGRRRQFDPVFDGRQIWRGAELGREKPPSLGVSRFRVHFLVAVGGSALDCPNPPAHRCSASLTGLPSPRSAFRYSGTAFRKTDGGLLTNKQDKKGWNHRAYYSRSSFLVPPPQRTSCRSGFVFALSWVDPQAALVAPQQRAGRNFFFMHSRLSWVSRLIQQCRADAAAA